MGRYTEGEGIFDLGRCNFPSYHQLSYFIKLFRENNFYMQTMICIGIKFDKKYSFEELKDPTPI